MFTFILTVVGLFVFVVTLFTKGFKAGFGRLAMFVISGIAIDVIFGIIVGTIVAIA